VEGELALCSNSKGSRSLLPFYLYKLTAKFIGAIIKLSRTSLRINRGKAMKEDEINTIEKFVNTLSEEEKALLINYLTAKTYESLSEKFDEILKESHEN
jgi:hypothetical protein